MAINSLSINDCSINALCGDRRAAIIATLLTETTVQKGRAARSRHIGHRHHVHEESAAIEFTELPIISVSVMMNGQTFSQAIERTSHDDIAIVTIRNFNAIQTEAVIVNISNIKFTRLFE